VESGVVFDEPSSFTNEHSIGTHLPFIAKIFPNVPVVPIIAKSPAVESEARLLVSALQENLPDDALVVFSMDCSHGLGSEKAFVNDTRTLSLIDEKNFSVIGILDETYIDSPFTLDAYLLWVEANDWQSDLTWHEHIGHLTGFVNEPGTSYLIFFAFEKKEEILKMTIVGDIMLSRAVGSKLYSVPVEQAFVGVYDEFLDSDLVFGNLESVLSTSTIESSKEIRFKADPARVDVLKFLNFTHLSVVNNHIGDYGRAAWDESVECLKAADLAPVGGYWNDGEIVYSEAAGKRIAFLAFDTTTHKITPEQIVEQISTADANLVIVSFHWGTEYQHLPSSEQIVLAHATIDAGADIVVGHHPHVLEGIEKYNDGLILYSLGNFVFDQFGEDENESLVVHLEWSEEEKSFELVPVRIEGHFPRTANGKETTETLERLASWSNASLREEILNGKIIW
jgi:poly-gamma-glutamate synthesis protein (capsule biosynthesis protein)